MGVVPGPLYGIVMRWNMETNMSEEEYIKPDASARGNSQSGSKGGSDAPRAFPDAPRNIILLLTEKPRMLVGEDGKPKPIKILVKATYEERVAAKAAGITLGNYDNIGKMCYDTAVLTGYPMSPISGIIPQFADVKEVPEGQLGDGFMINGEKLYPVGEPIEVLMPVGKNAQKILQFKKGGLAVVEDVTLRAPVIKGLSGSKGHDTFSGLVPVPNEVRNKDVKGLCFVACSDSHRVKDEDDKRPKGFRSWNEVLKDKLSGFFHMGPNEKTNDGRKSFIGSIMLTPTLWEARKREGDLPNAAPFMMGGIKGSMGVKVESQNAYKVDSVEGIATFAQEWQEHIKEEGSSAYAGCIVQMFRKTVDAKTGEMLDEVRAQAMFEKMRENGLQPQQAFMFVANDVKDMDTNTWHSRTSTEAMESALSMQERNVALMHARIEDKTNTSSIKAQTLRGRIDGGLWDVVVIPVQAWNVGKSMKDNAVKFDPLTNFQAHVLLPKNRSVNDSGNITTYNHLMAYTTYQPCSAGSFRTAKGEAPNEGVFAANPGICEGYLEVLEVEGGHTVADARPLNKFSEIVIPPSLFVTAFTPPEHLADMKAQITQLGVNAKAVEFGVRSKPAPAAVKEETVTQETTEEPSGPRF